MIAIVSNLVFDCIKVKAEALIKSHVINADTTVILASGPLCQSLSESLRLLMLLLLYYLLDLLFLFELLLNQLLLLDFMLLLVIVDL